MFSCLDFDDDLSGSLCELESKDIYSEEFLEKPLVWALVYSAGTAKTGG